MKARGMVGLVAFLLATVATGAVFLYIHGVRKQAETGGGVVKVIVSKKDIPAGTDLDTMIEQGAFAADSVARDDQIEGAITDLEQLKGRRTSVPILAGEQIPVARLQGSTELPGGALGIPEGFEGVTLQLDAQRMVGGTVRPGDHVQIFATFQPPVAEHMTMVLVPDVKVVRVQKSAVDERLSGQLVTLALRPGDAERVVFAQENGLVWSALLPVGQAGERKPPLTVGGLLK